MVKIRAARLSDIPALVALEAQFPTDRLSGSRFRYLLTRGNAQIMVCCEGKRVLGDVVILYRRNSARARMYSLVVDPDAQGRGLGRMLMQAAERRARLRQCSQICLEVRPDNARALELYQRTGYLISAKIVGFYEDGSPALRLCRQI